MNKTTEKVFSDFRQLYSIKSFKFMKRINKIIFCLMTEVTDIDLIKT